MRCRSALLRYLAEKSKVMYGVRGCLHRSCRRDDITSECSGLVMAEVMPAPIAIVKKVALIPSRFGNPKLTFDAPHVELTFNSSCILLAEILFSK